MAIFAVMGLGDDTTALKTSIEENYPTEHYALDNDKWFIAAPGQTTRTMATKLGMSEGSGKKGVVVSISGYNGLASTEVWEWLKAKMAGSNA